MKKWLNFFPFNELKAEYEIELGNGKTDFIERLQKFVRRDEPIFQLFPTHAFSGMLGNKGFSLIALRNFSGFGFRSAKMELEGVFETKLNQYILKVKMNESELTYFLRRFAFILPTTILVLMLTYYILADGPHNFFAILIPSFFSVGMFLTQLINKVFMNSEFEACKRFFEQLARKTP